MNSTESRKKKAGLDRKTTMEKKREAARADLAFFSGQAQINIETWVLLLEACAGAVRKGNKVGKERCCWTADAKCGRGRKQKKALSFR